MTSTEFKQLKERSKDTKEEIKRLLSLVNANPLSLMTVEEYKHVKTKVQNALRSIRAYKLAENIERCGSRVKVGSEVVRRVCSSLYCRKCREKAVYNYQQRLLKRFQEELKGDKNKLQDRWIYLTVLCAVTNFEVKEVSKAVDEARVVLGKFIRKYKGAWIEGAFEFELVDLDDVAVYDDDSSVKKATLRAMMSGNGTFTGKKILVHYHAVLDIGNRNDTHVREMKKWFNEKYNIHSRQTRLHYTVKYQDVKDKIWKISSYAFKNRLRYNKSFVTSGWKTGKHFRNRDAGRLIKLYDDFMNRRSGSVRSLLIGMGG